MPSAASPNTTTGAACSSSAPIAAGTKSSRRNRKFICPRRGRRVGGGACSERRGFVDQHDRDVVAHRIAQAVDGAHEGGLGLPVLELPLALGADEDRQELRRERHIEGSSKR